MEIACTHCDAQFNIPDEKIPKGRKFSLRCPKCKQTIQILPGDEGVQTTQQLQATQYQQPVVQQRLEYDTPAYNVADKPFGGILDKNAKTALICVTYPHANELAVKIFNSMHYHILNLDNVQTAITSMTYHLFNIIIVDDDFDINRKGYTQIIEYLNSLDMMLRRKIIVILISKNIVTLDNMAAFHESVNIVINYKQVNSMENFVQRAILEHEQMYAVFNESLKKIGKLN